jgi:hypothetical protein
VSILDVLGLFGLLAGAAAVLTTLLVKGKNKAIADNWQQVAESATARAEEATVRAATTAEENAKLLLRVQHLEQQVRVLAETITAKDAIDALARQMDQRFDDMTALVTEAIVTSGTPRAPGSARRNP